MKRKKEKGEEDKLTGESRVASRNKAGVASSHNDNIVFTLRRRAKVDRWDDHSLRSQSFAELVAGGGVAVPFGRVGKHIEGGEGANG
jgi:hypothetical protein